MWMLGTGYFFMTVNTKKVYRDSGSLQVVASLTCYLWIRREKERKGAEKLCKYIEYSPVLKANTFFVKELPAFLEIWWLLIMFKEVCCLSHSRHNWNYYTHSRSLPRTGHEGPKGEKRYSSTLSSTLVLDRSGWSIACPGRFPPPPPGRTR